jgi:eukaryotic-like serine/threonine-protein kinase
MSLYQRPSDSREESLLLESGQGVLPTDWSHDGRFILYQQSDPKTKEDVWVLPLTGDQKPFPLIRTEFDESEGRFSPDGRWVAYTSNESGDKEIYIQSFTPPPSSGVRRTVEKWRLSSGGGSHPSWRRDGKELFYTARDRKLMATEVKSASTFQAGASKALFAMRSRGTSYAATADGQRFLLETPAQGGSVPLTAVLNWAELLRR